MARRYACQRNVSDATDLQAIRPLIVVELANVDSDTAADDLAVCWIRIRASTGITNWRCRIHHLHADQECTATRVVIGRYIGECDIADGVHRECGIGAMVAVHLQICQRDQARGPIRKECHARRQRGGHRECRRIDRQTISAVIVERTIRDCDVIGRIHYNQRRSPAAVAAGTHIRERNRAGAGNRQSVPDVPVKRTGVSGDVAVPRRVAQDGAVAVVSSSGYISKVNVTRRIHRQSIITAIGVDFYISQGDWPRSG